MGGLKAEPSDLHIDLENLKRREQILFYSDVTLFEDELHDNGTAVCSVKIVNISSYCLQTFIPMECFQAISFIFRESCQLDFIFC